MPDEADALLAALQEEPVVSVRLNEDKLQGLELPELLNGATAVPW